MFLLRFIPLLYSAFSLFHVNATFAVRGNCSAPENNDGAYWTCYNGMVCKLRPKVGTEAKCVGKIKCIDNEWQVKPGKSWPDCKQKNCKSPDSITAEAKLINDANSYFRIIQILTTSSNGITLLIVVLLGLILRKLKKEKDDLQNEPAPLSDGLIFKSVSDILGQSNTFV